MHERAHLTPEEFREQGHRVVDWIADYWARLDGLPVLAQVRPGEVAAALPASLPEEPEPLDAVLADLDAMLVPGLTHWQHPRFFAYFPGNSSPAGVLGDLLSSGIGIQGMIWTTSPAATELEQVVLDQLREALGLPDAFARGGAGGGVIQDTASTATFTAVLAALHRATGGTARRDGVPAGTFAIYGSTQAHSSLLKAAMMSGLGERAVRSVAVDPKTQAMEVDALREAMAADRAAGVTPVMVQSAVGTTSTGAVDPTAAIAEVAQEHGAWLHVDAAWAGVAAVCPEHRWIHDGVEHADSYVTNPHKWLLTTFDCSAFWVRDRSALVGALSILPEYLRNPATESGAVVDYRDWHPQLGRRFRALKLWTVLRTLRAFRPARPHRDRRRPGLALRRAGACRRALRDRHRAGAGPRRLPGGRRRRSDDGADGGRQRVGGGVPLAHQGGGPYGAASRRRLVAHHRRRHRPHLGRAGGGPGENCRGGGE